MISDGEKTQHAPGLRGETRGGEAVLGAPQGGQPSPRGSPSFSDPGACTTWGFVLASSLAFPLGTCYIPRYSVEETEGRKKAEREGGWKEGRRGRRQEEVREPSPASASVFIVCLSHVRS